MNADAGAGSDARADLADQLNDAAEMEHRIMSMYLFAAVSLKNRIDEGQITYAQLELTRRWKSQLMSIARQEMEHLGIVCNLLTAIGEAPRLRPRASAVALPESSTGVGVPFRLAPFSAGLLLDFIRVEMPAGIDDAQRRLLSKGLGPFDPSQFDGVLKLYQSIRQLFMDIDECRLFIGPPSAQLGTTDIFPNTIRGLSPIGKPAYGVTLATVTNRPDAIAAIDLIIAQGEGSHVGTADCHFASFCQMYEELIEATAADPGFAPARPVVVNPSVHLGSDRTTITDPATLEVMALFDDAFAVVTTLLARFFMHTDQSVAESAAIQRATFFPLMTTVIRPLAEMLTHLPAFDDGPGRAGPSFDLPSREAFLPHRDAAWELIDQQLRALADRADHLRHDTRLPGAHLTRLDLMWENLDRVARDFGLRMGLRPEDVREA